MLPFRVSLQPGSPIYEQVIYAAKKAILTGAIEPGERFPSIRALSQGLKINPSTAHKVIGELVAEGLLEVHSTLGTLVAERARVADAERGRLLNTRVEQLVVEARTLGVELHELVEKLTKYWGQLQTTPVRVKP